MTSVTLHWGPKALLGLECRGHSGFAPSGEDVVCAAVSSLVHALLLGLCDVAQLEDLDCTVRPDDEDPLIRVFWPEDRADSLDLLTRTIALSIKEIASGNPGYVSLTEVQS